MKLPQGLPLQQMQNTWATGIEPVLNNEIVNGHILPNVALVTGTNQIPHKLGRKLTGWYIVRLRGAAQIYDTQDTENYPALNLSLVSNANVVVNLAVF